MITLIRVNFSYIHRDGHFGPLRLPISIWNSRSWTVTVVPPTISKVMSWQKALYDLNLPWNATDYDITSAFHQQQIQSPTLIADMAQTTMRRRLCSTIAGVSAHNIAIAPTLRILQIIHVPLPAPRHPGCGLLYTCGDKPRPYRLLLARPHWRSQPTITTGRREHKRTYPNHTEERYICTVTQLLSGTHGKFWQRHLPSQTCEDEWRNQANDIRL